MEDSKTFYEVLEVAESASLSEIRSSFLRLAKEYHPDRVPEHLTRLKAEAEEKFKKISEAWGVLQDAAKKKQYDEELKTIRGQQPSDNPDDYPPASSPPSYRTPDPTPQSPPPSSSQDGAPSFLGGKRVWVVVAIVVCGLYFLRSLVPSSLQTGVISTCSAAGGWQNFTAKREFRIGQPICAYAEALNANKNNRIDVAYTFTLLGPDHTTYATRHLQCLVQRTTAPSCEQNVPDLRLPANAPTGSYTLSVMMRDNLTGQTAQGMAAFDVTPMINVRAPQESAMLFEAMSSRQPFIGKAWDNTQHWPAKLTFTEVDGSSGHFTGQIEWASLNSVVKIEGVVYGPYVSFTETEYIRRGNSQLGVLYDLALNEGNKLQGSWSYQNRSGRASFAVPIGPFSIPDEKQADVPGDSGGVIDGEQHDEVAKSVIAIQTVPGDSTVSLDGRNYGESTTDGTFLVRDVSPGSHELIVRKTGYQEFQSLLPIVAGQETKVVAQLKLMVGKLTVQTIPAAEIIVDGSDRGVADTQGYLALYDLRAGIHQVTVRKLGYSDGQFSAELAAGEARNLQAQLKWNGGYLTVRVNPVGAAISVVGTTQLSGTWNDSQCPAGTYTITASQAGMKTESRTLVVQPGQHATVEFSLLTDSDFIKTRLGEAKVDSPNTSVETAHEVLGLDRANVDAQTVLAESFFKRGDMQRFDSAATKVLKAGGHISLEFTHFDEPPGPSSHTTTLVLSSLSMSFFPKPGGKECGLSFEAIPLRQLQTVEVGHRTPGQVFLHLKYHDGSSGKSHDLRLWMSGAHATKQQVSHGALGNRIVFTDEENVIVSPGEAPTVLDAVANVIKSAQQKP